MKKIDKPWGFELIWAHTEKYVGKFLHINNGFSLSLQYHNIKDETICVKSGILTLEIVENGVKKFFKLKEGETFRITPKMIHRMSSDDGDVIVIEVSTPELSDVVRLADNYGRV